MVVNGLQILLQVPIHYQAKDGENKHAYQLKTVILIKKQILQTDV